VGGTPATGKLRQCKASIPRHLADCLYVHCTRPWLRAGLLCPFLPRRSLPCMHAHTHVYYRIGMRPTIHPAPTSKPHSRRTSPHKHPPFGCLQTTKQTDRHRGRIREFRGRGGTWRPSTGRPTSASTILQHRTIVRIRQTGDGSSLRSRRKKRIAICRGR
jgi:hypothetical protein